MKFADYFPQLDAHSTKDSRIFQTKWERNTRHPGLNTQKTKTYFCCTLGVEGSCWGIDVVRPLGTDAQDQCEEAFKKVIWAADYYEIHDKWPTSTKSTKKTSDLTK
jgi:hypothetical protein